jgi:hypothetical protein
MTESSTDATLDQRLDYLQLLYLKAHCRPLATEAAAHHWTHLDYLGRLVEGEAAARQDPRPGPPDQRCPLPGTQNPGELPLGLAQKD